MAYNWYDTKKLSINSMLLLDRWILQRLIRLKDSPIKDNTFDIAMCGYVLGVDIKQEISNMEHVTKHGGYIIIFMGDDERENTKPNERLLEEGFEYSHYISKTGGDAYRYWKGVVKEGFYGKM
ncbi:MAG: hypothetical protein ACOZCL_06645 [Bacillota bacterium]